ncbi:hypothetical protein JRO89_XS11G0180800 [Xanthoceras sorbifolium]|uniref:Pentatricopeptide repeat-containing protein n=1 Tax=Xanthoceras sorbifolium TaxID=99658 RepID=A0ABQ8HG05_9ROSI|nr:hypothetical protein JRO89_XS11G0180800 [Xanthoceras sorbifolium]
MQVTRFITSRLFTFSTTTPKPDRASKKLISIDSIKELHAHLIRTQLHTDPSSISPVIRSYALSPSHLHKAHLVFDQIQRPTLLVFNHMIHGLSQSDQPRKAIHMYYNMCLQALSGDNLTFLFVFKACARVKDVFHGQKVHVHAIKLGFESYLFVSNALIHMYASCGELGFARKVFSEMCERDLVSWNSLICGYSQWNRFEEVLGLFDSMRAASVKADAVTMVKVVLACIYLANWDVADSMVKYIKENNIEIDVYLGNTLIDMYGRRGLVNLAREVFNRMQERNVVSWNAMIRGYTKASNLVEGRKLFNEMPRKDVISWTSMIAGYSQANQFAEAVKLFQEMMLANAKPDEITVATVLSACSHLGLLDVGEAIHDYVKSHGVKEDVYLLNSFIDMYCKCGVIEKALMVFHEMKKKDSVSWTSVISGLAVNGFANHALELFQQMLREGVRPTHGTFVGILLACSHAGLIEEGLEYFDSMEKVYGLAPEIKHYGCVVDLLSRSGNLDRAYEFINTMPMVPGVVVWRILLSACKLHGNLALAEIITDKLLELDPSNSGNYVLLSNTFAGSGRWDDAGRIRGLMEESSVLKPSGWSSIEVNGISTNKL